MIDYISFREKLKKEMIQVTSEPNPEQGLAEFVKQYFDRSTRMEIIQIAEELTKAGKVDVGMYIARLFQLDPDPPADDPMNKAIEDGKETHSINSVRGMLCWLLQDIVNKHKTSYFSEILDMLEGRASDTSEQKKLRLATGESLYVRRHATIPLALLAANRFAKQNSDGTPYFFGDRNKVRVETLAFRMLEENRDHPRILEYLANVFEKFRNLNKAEAQHVLELFFYNSDAKLNPEYVLEHVCMLALFFAEFRGIAYKEEFDHGWFQKFFMKVLEEAPTRIKSHCVWLFWKVCGEDAEYFKRIEKYIPLLLEGEYNNQVANTLGNLLETIIDKNYIEVIKLFSDILDYVEKGVGSKIIQGYAFWFDYTEEILPKIAAKDPELFLKFLERLTQLMRRGVFVGSPEIIFGLSWKQVPKDQRSGLKQKIQSLYATVRNTDNRHPEIDWDKDE